MRKAKIELYSAYLKETLSEPSNPKKTRTINNNLGRVRAILLLIKSQQIKFLH
jgi:hypothetical protein